MFQTAQWAQGSEAAASLAQMAARGAKGDAALAALVRERQDLVAEWQKRDACAQRGRVAGARQARPRGRGRQRGAACRHRRAHRRDRQAAGGRLPRLRGAGAPEPLSVEEVQAQLRADEALVLFLDTPEWKPTPEETFIWVVTKTDMRWVRSELGTPALTREVAALRCGLDAALWDDEAAGRPLPRSRQGASRSATGSATSAPRPLPFDVARAHALYKALFGQVEDLISDKHLLIVPSGPLTQLPFQVLVTAPAQPMANYHVCGVARTQPRHHRAAGRLLAQGPAPRRQAERGDQADDRLRQPAARRRSGRAAVEPAKWAALAREKQACNGTAQLQQVARTARAHGAWRPARRRAADGRRRSRQLRDADAAARHRRRAVRGGPRPRSSMPSDILLGARRPRATIKALSAERRARPAIASCTSPPTARWPARSPAPASRA